MTRSLQAVIRCLAACVMGRIGVLGPDPDACHAAACARRRVLRHRFLLPPSEAAHEVFEMRARKSHRGEVLRGMRRAAWRRCAPVAAPSFRRPPSSARSAASRPARPPRRDPPSSARFGAPESYTPKHLAEKILTSRAALEGERKQVTALFADLKGSMELFADRDPEDARKILDPVLDHMMEAVHRFEGTVNHVMGDGIMALFGAPLAHEDAAVRACYAALRMQETVKRYAEGVRRSEGIPIQIRVGLNSGEVVVRSIGSDLRMDYTVVGQTMNVAARMEQMAVPGSILISADTLAMAEGYVQVKPLGAMKVKGLDAPARGLRGDGRGHGALAHGSGRGARAHAVRGPRGRAAGTQQGARKGPRRARASWWPSSASPASASRGCSGSSSTPIGPTAGSSSKAARRRTASPTSICR